MLSPLNADYKIPVLTLALCSSTASSAPRPRRSSSFSWRAEQAAAFISEVEEDESELADELRIEEISLDASAN